MTEQIAVEEQRFDPLDRLAEFLGSAIDKTDEAAAIERVTELRNSHPNAGNDELVTRLIQQKCILTGGMGALTSAVSLIGVPLNIGLTFKWQAELVLEIATVYNRTLTDAEKHRIILIVTGVSVGTTQVTRLFTRWVERMVSKQVAQSSTARITLPPLVGSIVSASTNVLFTYLIARRAQIYFQRAPEPVEADPSGAASLVA
jgi:uncharacterized protein (DUF697 family)